MKATVSSCRRKHIIFKSTQVLISALVVLAPLDVYAWELVADRGRTKAYIDRSKISKQGDDLLVVWVSNFDEPQRIKDGRSHLLKNSMLYRSRFDCQNKYFLVEESIYYDDHFAKSFGHTTRSRTNPQWWTPDKKCIKET